MTSRSWRWLRIRIQGLLSAPAASYTWTGQPVWATRLQMAVIPAPNEQGEESPAK